MTVGQRIAQKRKELGLSQEGLGEQLGVSRQAIYKWESDATLPEIEKLIALSKIFGVPVGWLLGVEDPAADDSVETNGQEQQNSGELTQAQLNMVEEIVRRYQEAQPVQPKRRKWPWVLAAVILVIVFARMFSMLNELQNNYNRVQNSVDYIDRNVDNQISSITNRVEDVLERMNSFTVEHSAEITDADLAGNTVTFELKAVPKTYTEGMTVLFQAEHGDGVVEVEAVQGDNQNYTAMLTCPLTDEIVISAVFITGDKRETQKIQTFYELYSNSFPVRYISSGPLFFDLEGDVFQARALHVSLGTHSSKDMVVAQARDMRLGLFCDSELVYWLEKLEEQPENFYGNYDENDLFFRNTREYTLDRGLEYCLALVVTDEYDREIVLPEIPIVYEWGEVGENAEDDGTGDWTYSSNAEMSSDPADWDY